MIDVYCHTSPSGKSYVGIASQGMRSRWRSHTFEARHAGRLPLHAAIRKYGPEAFTSTVLEVCGSRGEAELAERRWILALGTKIPGGYNATDGGEGVSGLSAQTREAMRLKAVGRVVSAESRARMRASHLGVKRGPHSAEHSARISAANTGKVLSAETRDKLRAANLGKTHSAETRAKMSAAQRARSADPGTGAKISAAKRKYPVLRIAPSWRSV